MAKTSKKQLGYVRDWEKRNPSRAQARKNKWWQTAKGKAWLKAHQKKRSAYRKRWRAKQRKLRRQNSANNQNPADA